MNKKYVLKQSRFFDDIIKNTKPKKGIKVIIYIKENIEGHNRYGICISKKQGKAVYRNKIKRKIKETIRLSNLFEGNNDIIIIVTSKINNKNEFEKLQEELIEFIKKQEK